MNTNDLRLDAEVLKQFRIVHQSLRRQYQATEQQSGISGVQVWVLSVIAQHPGLSVQRLSKAIAIQPSTASNLIEKMVNKGLVRRCRTAQDARATSLYATDAGLAVLSDAPTPHNGILADGLARLSADSLRQLHKHLACLISTMQDLDRSAADTAPLSEI
jgi:DNA-binding MarR family transcriptional regulator